MSSSRTKSDGRASSGLPLQKQKIPRHDLLEHQPEVLAFVAVKLDLDRLAIGLLYVKCQVGLAGRLKPKIKIVTHRAAVDLRDAIVRP